MSSIPLPSSLTEQPVDRQRSKFIIEPLYPGYGTTVGNALRRILLSSLAGAAITAVKFEGATHEFSTLPYVKEDVVDIILNLKLVRIKSHSAEPVTVTLKASGAKTVTAGDMTPNAEIEMVNPHQVIATLTDKAASFEVELTVAPGRGYVPVENREKEKLPIGTIAIDALYSPVKNVNFTTEHVRVEQITNFDKLIIEVATDGSITPSDALHQAAEIMVEHFQFVVNGPTAAQGEAEVTKAPAEEVATDEPSVSDADDKPKKKATRKKKADEA